MKVPRVDWCIHVGGIDLTGVTGVPVHQLVRVPIYARTAALTILTVLVQQASLIQLFLINPYDDDDSYDVFLNRFM